MRKTPVEDYLEEISTTLSEETYGRLSDAIYETNVDFDQEIESRVAENAKLRELVADMWRFTGTACKKYPRLFEPAAQGGQMVQLNMLDSFEQRMQDLGIEVPE